MQDTSGQDLAGHLITGTDILALLTGLLAAWCLCSLLVVVGRRHLLDVPVARSAHQQAVPRGGGAAIVTGLALAIAVLLFSGTLTLQYTLVLACALPVAMVGFIDDFKALPVRIRLPLHLISAASALWLLGPVPEPFFSGWLVMPSWLQALILMLALVWLLNLYNFMDGIDTLAAAQCLFVCAAAGLMLWRLDDPLMLVCAALFAATLGFLYWNVPPARLFMGDVGSTFLGFFLGLLGLITHFNGVLSVWVWVLLMATFIADTTLTLLRRLLAGHSITEGHSTHAYQHLSRRWGSHLRVTAAYMVVNVLWSLPLAWLALTRPEYGVLFAISGIVPLMIVAALLGAGNRERQ
ncbi:MAG: glycosyltransferase family 4 protein [Pseudomonadota bacterium]|uniref:MraY family glycosyltransferase n=1 Tax=Pseudohongiella sp. O18 TaxID=2904248 RepID=UPI001F1D7D35|nr:glycosyltransferase family 4 protein [Pseudohongiella sp. O18]MEC8860168.1 glycosyltransferase family 4 protein [Pseudomonadota bacterium]